MNEPLQMGRSIATLSLPLDEMRAVGKRFDATLNDLAVTLVDEGVHRYLRHSARAFPHRLVAFCPVSLREAGDTGTGTRVSAVFVHLGRHDATAVERIHQVVAAMGTAKHEMRSMSKDAAMTYAVSLLGVAELAAATHVDRVTPPLANMVISNVPGPPTPLYGEIGRVRRIYPLGPVQQHYCNLVYAVQHLAVRRRAVRMPAICHVHGFRASPSPAPKSRRRRSPAGRRTAAPEFGIVRFGIVLPVDLPPALEG
jgi:hypothetical protein